ncbi:MAG: class I SAM-dependent methyltransferase [Pseudomonadota bacterium]
MTSATMTHPPQETVPQDPRPAPSKDARFWDRISKRYAAKPVSDESAYQKKLAITRGYLSPQMEVLEFGCGTGSTAIAHAPFVESILATDISGGMLDIARNKAATERVENVRFEQTALEAFQAPAASFDAVLGLSVLHLLHDPRAAVAKVHTLLKPDGIFITSTPCLKEMAPWIKYVAPLARAVGLFPPVLRVFGEDALQKNLTAEGFEVIYRWQPKPKSAVFIVARKRG